VEKRDRRGAREAGSGARERGDDAVATRRFVDAVQLDPTYGPAYLELAAARERAG